ncbi:AraC family transcriptional regulator [Streptomyces sp. NPDC047461]|uniref:AraC-like ligand-binding domain-containing protein n=1 Tax=Streptomyces sp. NPDC047461 TaxID=3155619 RepID=UPI0033C99595
MSTQSVDPADRIDFWEEHIRRALVGLTCSSYSQEGLLATETNIEVCELRVADISGNEHIIERTPRTCQSLPKDSIFVTLLTAGCGVFFHEGGCVTLQTGDLILYDTRRPYLFGFPSRMRQLLVDIPREVFAAQCAPGEVSAPMLLGRGSAAEGAPASALEAVVADWVTGQGGDDSISTQATVLDLVRALAAPRLGGCVPPAMLSQLAVAKDYMARHLADPGLSSGRVAEAIGVSPRHLSRVFQPTGVSPFTRVFRSRFGRTPGEARPFIT